MRMRAVLLLTVMVGLTSYMASRATPTVAVNIAGDNDVAQQHLLSPQRQKLRAQEQAAERATDSGSGTSARSAAATATAPAGVAPLGYEEQHTVDLLRLKLQAGPTFAVRDVHLALHPDTLLVCGQYRLAADSLFTPFARVNGALFVAHETGVDQQAARRAFARCGASAPTTDTTP